MNISQEYEIEDLLNDLGIEVEDSARISDGEITYFIFSTSNLEEEEKELFRELDINEVDGLFISKKSLYAFSDVSNLIIPIYSEEEGLLWRNIINKIKTINSGYMSKKRPMLFKLDYSHFSIL